MLEINEAPRREPAVCLQLCGHLGQRGAGKRGIEKHQIEPTRRALEVLRGPQVHQLGDRGVRAPFAQYIA